MKSLSPGKEILPNPSGGVNTHLLRNVAYVIGIVPVAFPTYSPLLRSGGREAGRRLALLGSLCE